MNTVATYLKPMLDIGKSRKFWVGMMSAVATYLVSTIGQTELGVLITSLLGAFGVYAVPNSK